VVPVTALRRSEVVRRSRHRQRHPDPELLFRGFAAGAGLLRVRLRGGFKGIDAAGAQAAFDAMCSNPLRMLLYSGIIIALTAIIIARGINKGIERSPAC
jgi:hypothetical protein